jgi:hypothetical protein
VGAAALVSGRVVAAIYMISVSMAMLAALMGVEGIGLAGAARAFSMAAAPRSAAPMLESRQDTILGGGSVHDRHQTWKALVRLDLDPFTPLCESRFLISNETPHYWMASTRTPPPPRELHAYCMVALQGVRFSIFARMVHGDQIDQ